MSRPHATDAISAATLFRVALIGARGYVGRELIHLMVEHPHLELVVASSRSLAQTPVRDVAPAYTGDLTFVDLAPADIPWADVDVAVLALPNGKSDAYLAEIEKHAPSTVVVDLSADHRFESHWDYGLPERNRARLRGSKRIANPGCYATGMQLGLFPLLDMLQVPPSVFGVSGYSGAGTTPSPKNDLENLRDNLIPYAFIGHIHEKEVSRHLSQPIHFMPHVASWFRGIHLTIDCHLLDSKIPDEWRSDGDEATLDIASHYERFYKDEALVLTFANSPAVQKIQGQHHVEIGGFSFSRSARRLSFCVTLDNLLKGAATQAIQNLNLSLGLEEHLGICVGSPPTLTSA